MQPPRPPQLQHQRYDNLTFRPGGAGLHQGQPQHRHHFQQQRQQLEHHYQNHFFTTIYDSDDPGHLNHASFEFDPSPNQQQMVRALM